MKDLTEKELTQLTYLTAFNANFEEITIKKSHRTYIVFMEMPNEALNNYEFTTTSLAELNGLLIGAVKAKHKRFKALINTVI